MSRFIPQSEMTAAELVTCSYQARAVIGLCEQASWAVQNNPQNNELAGHITTGLQLALQLLEPVHDALELQQMGREV